MTDTATDQVAHARRLLEEGASVRETAKETGLSKGRVETIRAELAGAWRASGRGELPRAKPGPANADLGVMVPRRLIEELDARAAAAGMTREEFVIRALWPEESAT